MSKLRSMLIDDLSLLVLAFQSPLPIGLTAEGWDVELWGKWGRVFQELLELTSSGGLASDVSIARAMDFDGITHGEILSRAASISNGLRELRKEV